MYIKQIISVHPRSSCTIFCAKCGTALLKIRPFEGFAPQLYPENPKMRYSSTQAPASPSALTSRISLHHISRISLLPGFRGFSLRHSTYGSLRRCTEPAAIARKRRGTGGETAVKRRKNGGTSGKTENRRRTGGEPAGKRRGKGGEPAKNGETSGRTEKRKRTENRRGREEREEKRRNRRRTEKRRGNGGTGGKTENRRRREGKRRRNGGEAAAGGRTLSTGGDVRIALNFSDF